MNVSEHFTLQEIACHHCGVNGAKPELIDALEKLRWLLNRPIIVDDAYRCPTHNAEVGGVSNSQHVQGIAADIKVNGMTCKELYLVIRESELFGGVGVDEHKGYVHVDLRPGSHRWTYDIHGHQAPWDFGLDAQKGNVTNA